MSGGHATSAGIEFQTATAAWLSAFILAGAAPTPFDLPSGVLIESLLLEVPAAVDDIVAGTSDRGYCFINVKSTVDISDRPDSAFASAIDQFVRQWLSCARGEGQRPWERPLDSSRDRLVLAVDATKSFGFARTAIQLLARIRDAGSLLGPSADLNEAEARLYRALDARTRASWAAATSAEPSDQDVAGVLKLIRVVGLSFPGADLDTSQSLLRREVLADPNSSLTAWAALATACLRFARTRSGANRAGLQDVLRAAEILPATSADFRADIGKLIAATEEALRSIEHLAQLRPHDAKDPVTMERACTAALAECAPRASFLVIGEPGAGKSGALHAAARQLLAAGHPVLVLAVDRYQVHTLRQLESELRLDHSLVDVLKQWSDAKQGVLLIDALDASRGGPADRVFRDLLGLTLPLPNWSTVASIRRFDLRYGSAYQDLFAGTPPAAQEEFRDPEFAHLAHVLVRPLGNDELGQVWHRSPAMQAAYDGASAELQRLLHTPFNLFLLAAILQTGGAATGSISTQIQLLDRYWDRRVGGSDTAALSRERVLSSLTDGMVRANALAISFTDLPPLADQSLPELLSAELVLRSPINTIAFSHHMLFDYAVARLILRRGQADDLVRRLTDSDEHALLLAPAAMLALRMLWSDDPEHAGYWKVALSMARSTAPGAFCKMLPARAMADLVKGVEDVEPLVRELHSADPARINAARFLITHCFLAITAEITEAKQVIADAQSPWPGIAQRLADQDVQVWPWKAVVGHWCEKIETVAPEHLPSLNTLARQLLNNALASAQDDGGSIACGVQGTVRTIEANVEASVAALRPLLEEPRVSQFGHKNLFWLGQEVVRLTRHAPELARDFYVAVYCRALPSADEKTYVGAPSRIIGLVTNKQQDFKGIRWHLSTVFPAVLQRAPGFATEALIRCLDYFVRHERHVRDDIAAIPFTILGHPASFVADDSGYWWDSRSSPTEDYEVAGLLSKFVSVLPSWADDRIVIDEVVKQLAQSAGWASGWTSWLRAAVEAPEKFASLILPLLSEPGILDSQDGRYAAGKALSACHPHWEVGQKQAVERAILRTERKRSREVLLACLSPDQIALPEAAAARADAEKAGSLPANRPLIEVSSGWEGGDWYRRKLGVDEHPIEASVYDLAKSIDIESARPSAKTPAELRKTVADHWPQVLQLADRLLNEAPAKEELRELAWDKIARNLTTAAENCQTAEHLALFPELASLIDTVLDRAPWPSPEPDQKIEARFADQPSWGFAPRGYAAEALMALGRATGQVSPEQRHRLLGLAVDGSPIVRHQILARVNTLIDVAPDLVRELCDLGFTQEQNPGVQQFFIGSCRAILSRWPDYFDAHIERLERQAPSQDGGSQQLELLVDTILRLWLTYDRPIARSRVQEWAERPLEFETRVINALFLLHTALSPRGPESRSAAAERVSQATVAFFYQVTQHTAPLFIEAMAQTDIAEEVKNQAQSALHILDAAMMRIYSASGAMAKRFGARVAERRDEPERSHFLNALWPTLEIMATVPYPSVTHNFLQTIEDFIDDDPVRIFGLLLNGALKGGRLGGYQLEGMGADLFVKIIRRYLADYRNIFAQRPDFRQGLIEALDYFVGVGWPDARRLAYELPEMLR